MFDRAAAELFRLEAEDALVDYADPVHPTDGGWLIASVVAGYVDQSGGITDPMKEVARDFWAGVADDDGVPPHRHFIHFQGRAHTHCAHVAAMADAAVVRLGAQAPHLLCRACTDSE